MVGFVALTGLTATIGSVATLTHAATPAGASQTTATFGSPVTGTFYPDNSSSGGRAFDPTQLNSPYFTENFPLINFNPECSGCNFGTSVNGDTQPFTDVIPNVNGATITQPAQGNGVAAYDNNHLQFEATFTSTLSVQSPGDITFEANADDGWMLGSAPVVGGTAQPAYVSGTQYNLPNPAVSPLRGYPLLGGFNYGEAGQQTTLTVNFPVRGNYPVEIDYTECCGFPATFTFGTGSQDPGISTLTLVSPTGSPLSTAETFGRGSPSESCQNCNSPAPNSDKQGDPVDTATGDFSESATDLTLPGAGVPLSLTRTYDAQAAQAEVSAGAPPGPLGYGWADNLNMSVAYNSMTQIATVTEEDGAQTSYQATSSFAPGTEPSWCSTAANFCPSAPRIEATLNHNADGTWTLIRTVSRPETFSFSTAGLLAAITDAGGDSLGESSYVQGAGQTPCPSGDSCAAWSSSASGRELVLATNGTGQLVSVFDANSTQLAIFSYSGSGCSTWGSGQSPDLCSAIDPGGITSTYTYDPGNPQR